MRRFDFIAAVYGAVALIVAAVSFSAAQIVTFQPLPLKQFLEENGWVPLPLPDRRMGPGSVINVTRKDGAVTMQWLGDLRRCGIPDREFRYVRGKYSSDGNGDSFGIDASIAIRYIVKLEGKADFEKAGSAIMRIEASGGDAVDFDALTNWIARSDAAQRMPRTCNNFLAQEDIYLVTEAFRISKASYGLVDKNGAKLTITGGAFGQAGSRSSSTLNVVEDLYFGVRHVKQLALDLFEPAPGPRTVPEADGLLRLMEP
jgi:hypothetical protein